MRPARVQFFVGALLEDEELKSQVVFRESDEERGGGGGRSVSRV